MIKKDYILIAVFLSLFSGCSLTQKTKKIERSISSPEGIKRVGNGGGGFLCLDDNGKKSFTIIDIFEGEKLKQLKYFNFNSVNEYFKIAEERLAFDENLSKNFNSELKNTFARVNFLPANAGLETTDDVNGVIYKKNNSQQNEKCTYHTIANYNDEKNEILIDSDLFNLLDEKNKAAIYLHETLYKLARKYIKKRDSTTVRILVSYLMADGEYSKEISILSHNLFASIPSVVEVVIAPIYENVRYFNKNGFAIVSYNGKQNVINEKKEIQFKTGFDSIEFSSFKHKRIFFVKNDNQKYIIDEHGKTIFSHKYYFLSDFNESGYAYFIKANQIGIVHISGTETFIDNFTNIYNNHYGGVYFQNNELCYISSLRKSKCVNINGTNLTVEPAQAIFSLSDSSWYVLYNNDSITVKDKISGKSFNLESKGIVSHIGCNIFKVENHQNKAKYFDETGLHLGNEEFDTSPSEFKCKHNIFPIIKNKKIGLMNKKGEYVIPPKFDDIKFDYANYIQPTAVKLNDKWGYVDEFGIPMIPPEYDDAFVFTNGVGVVRADNKYYLIDRNGSKKDLPYSVLTVFYNDIAIYSYKNKYGLINYQGKTLTDDSYTYIGVSNSKNFQNTNEEMIPFCINAKCGFLKIN